VCISWTNKEFDVINWRCSREDLQEDVWISSETQNRPWGRCLIWGFVGGWYKDVQRHAYELCADLRSAAFSLWILVFEDVTRSEWFVHPEGRAFI
jgi:hypothetical protein